MEGDCDGTIDGDSEGVVDGNSEDLDGWLEGAAEGR